MKLDDLKLTEAEDEGRVGEIPRQIFVGYRQKLIVWGLDALGIDALTKGRGSKRVEVHVHGDEGQGVTDLHRAAFGHFMRRPKTYEKRLLKYLQGKSLANLEECKEEHDGDEVEKFAKRYKLRTLEGLKVQVEWLYLTVFDAGWEQHGLVAFDFRCAWDPEHGISVLMHRGQVVADGRIADFTCRGDSLVGHARVCQEHQEGFDVTVPKMPRAARRRG